MPHCQLKQLTPLFNVILNRPPELFQIAIRHITQPTQDLTLQLVLNMFIVTGKELHQQLG